MDTLVSNSLWKSGLLSHESGLRISWLLYLMLMPASASGGRFSERNALKLSELILVVLFPLIRMLSKHMQTSGTMALPSESLAVAISTDEIRFSLPSVRGEPIGSWLPVNITGFVSPSIMKLRTEAE
mgnify:CR=1 FL=1